MATFYFLLEADGTSKLLKEDADYLVGETHDAAAGQPTMRRWINVPGMPSGVPLQKLSFIFLLMVIPAW